MNLWIAQIPIIGTYINDKPIAASVMEDSIKCLISNTISRRDRILVFPRTNHPHHHQEVYRVPQRDETF